MEFSGYDSVKFKEVLEQSKEYLLRLSNEKGSEIIKEVLKNPNFDDTDVYYLAMIEVQDPSYKPPTSVVPKTPVPHKIRFVMSERQLPTKPVWEEVKAAAKKTEETGRKRPRYSSDSEFDDEEEDKYYREVKKRAKKKKTQSVSVHNPPERKTPLKIRFVMFGRKPAKPICEEENSGKKTEKIGRKRPRASSDCESDDEEEKERVVKKRANKKKKVNNNLVQERKVVLPEIRPDLPDGMKERIRNLDGTEVTLVIQKMLTATDLSSSHGRLSLPRGKLIDKGFLGGKDVALIEARLVGENGKEREIDIRQWRMSKGIYNVVKGWNEVVGDHKLCQDLVVQLWSFRVEGNLWFALVKLWKVKK